MYFNEKTFSSIILTFWNKILALQQFKTTVQYSFRIRHLHLNDFEEKSEMVQISDIFSRSENYEKNFDFKNKLWIIYTRRWQHLGKVVVHGLVVYCETFEEKKYQQSCEKLMSGDIYCIDNTIWISI